MNLAFVVFLMYTINMNIEKLKEIHKAQSFQPFRMHIADGGVIDVTHPESLAYSPKGRTVVVVFPDDTSQWIDLLLVSRIEVGNGRSRRKKTKK